MRNQKRFGPTGLAVAIGTLCLGGCVCHDVYYKAHRYGSLKDAPIATVSTKPAARVRSERRTPVRRAKKSAQRNASVASTEPAPYVKAPPPAPPARPTTEPESEPAGAAPKVVIPAPSARSPQTPETPLPPVDDPAAVAQMLSEGRTLFEQGEVVQARRRFVAAMNGPDPEVLLALARSYDTYYLSRLPTADGAPDMQRALGLYERALEGGAQDAAPDLERTREVLKIPR